MSLKSVAERLASQIQDFTVDQLTVCNSLQGNSRDKVWLVTRGATLKRKKERKIKHTKHGADEQSQTKANDHDEASAATPDLSRPPDSRREHKARASTWQSRMTPQRQEMVGRHGGVG